MTDHLWRQPPRGESRFLELDVMRGICAVAVLLYHYFIRFDMLVGFGGTPRPDLHEVHPWTWTWGVLPVMVFFTISGFVIAMTVERSPAGLDFLVSRFSRIFPVYWAAIFLTYALWSLWPVFEWSITIPQLLVNFTMLQELFRVPSVDGVYWSLKVELLFYAATYAIVAAGLWRHLRIICACWLGVAVFYAVFGEQVHFSYTVSEILNLKYAPHFVAGIALYRLRKVGADFSSQTRNDWALLVAAMLSFFFVQTQGEAPYMVAAIVFWCMCIFDKLKFIAVQPLLFLGAISYALYLTHQMIGYQVLVYAPGGPILKIAIATCVAIAIATALTYGIERPAQRFLRTQYRAMRQNASPTLRQPAA